MANNGCKQLQKKKNKREVMKAKTTRTKGQKLRRNSLTFKPTLFMSEPTKKST